MGSASTDLTPSELTINQFTGLISVYTASSATEGTHTVTVMAELPSFPTITLVLTTFTITIQPQVNFPFYFNQPPLFKQPLVY
jgi:hypothetical protein